jgi:hypothetical protein
MSIIGRCHLTICVACRNVGTASSRCHERRQGGEQDVQLVVEYNTHVAACRRAGLKAMT